MIVYIHGGYWQFLRYFMSIKTFRIYKNAEWRFSSGISHIYFVWSQGEELFEVSTIFGTLFKKKFSHAKPINFFHLTGQTHPHQNTALIKPKITISKRHLRFQNPLRNFVLKSILKWSSSKISFIVEHGFANRVEVCNYTLMMFACAFCAFHKSIWKSAFNREYLPFTWKFFLKNTFYLKMFFEKYFLFENFFWKTLFIWKCFLKNTFYLKIFLKNIFYLKSFF